MSTVLQDFGQCLAQLLKEKKVSASELARMMAYKSRNSIFRILDGKGGHGARQAFFLRLKEENPLGLAEEELSQLEEALEVSRVGAEAYRSNLAMRELMGSAGGKLASMRIVRYDGRNGWDSLMRALESRQIEMIVFGCCERQIMSDMRERLAARGVKEGLRVLHFIYTGQEELVRSISAIQPMLYADFYSAYGIEPGLFSKAREQFYSNNAVFMRWLDEKDVWHEQLFALADTDLFLAHREGRAQAYDAIRAILEEDMQRMTPLNPAFASSGETPDYVAYTDMCRRLEQGRAIYMVKLDVPFPFIDTDILVPCAMGSFADAPEEGMAQIMKALTNVHAKRFENIFAKRRPTHTIFSSDFMERFARTGRQTDHFFALRPYTPQERVKILRHILRQTRENPYFNVYFFRPGFEPPLMEITLYEGAGTLMSKPFTDYNLAGDHAEAIITSEAFCACYKSYFTEDLLLRQVMTKEETEAELERLIRIAENA